MVIHIIIILVTFWLFISLIDYGTKTKRWRMNQKSKSEEMNTGLVYSSVVACAFFCLLFLGTNIAYINVGFASGDPGKDELCDSMGDAVFAMYSIILLCVYFFLWLRQRVFYNNFLLNLEYSKFLRVFSSICILLILLPGIASVVFNSIPNDYTASSQGCLYMPTEDLRVAYWVSIVLVLVVGQLILLLLFVYALKKTSGESVTKSCLWCCPNKSNAIRKTPSKVNRQVSKAQSINYSSSNEVKKRQFSRSVSTTSLSQEDQSVAVQRILRKTLIFAVTSTLSDVLAQVVIHYLTQPDHHRRVPATVVAVNALLNLLFLILSFAKYKEIIASPCVSIKKKLLKCRRLESDCNTRVTELTK